MNNQEIIEGSLMGREREREREKIEIKKTIWLFILSI